jgi:hypothetical protein
MKTSMRSAQHVCIGEMIIAFKIYVHKPEWKRLLRKITLELKDNIKTVYFWNRT